MKEGRYKTHCGGFGKNIGESYEIYKKFEGFGKHLSGE